MSTSSESFQCFDTPSKSKQEWLSFFQNHPNRSLIEFDKKEKRFECPMLGGAAFQGITDKLRDTLWSDYQYGKGTRSSSEEYSLEISKAHLHSDDLSTGERISVRSLSEGTIRGQLMHQELRKYVDKPAEYLNKAKTREKRTGKKLYATVINGIGTLKKNKLVPLLAEVPVGDVNRHNATAIDALCVHTETGRLAIVEWKTGYTGCFEISNGTLNLPVEHFRNGDNDRIPNSPRNQAQCQLAITVLFFERIFGITPGYACVIHANDHGATLYPLRSDFYRSRQVLYDHVYDIHTLQQCIGSSRRKRRHQEKKKSMKVKSTKRNPYSRTPGVQKKGKSKKKGKSSVVQI